MAQRRAGICGRTRADFRGRMQQTLAQGSKHTCLWFSGACMEDSCVSMYISLFWQPFRGYVAGLAAAPIFASKQWLLSVLLANLCRNRRECTCGGSCSLHKTSPVRVCECMCVPFYRGSLLSEQGGSPGAALLMLLRTVD